MARGLESLEERVANGLVEEVVQELTTRLVSGGYSDLAQVLKKVDPVLVADVLRKPLSGEEMVSLVHEAVEKVIVDSVGNADAERVLPAAQEVLNETVVPALGECRVKKVTRDYTNLYGWLQYVQKRYIEEKRWRSRWMWITITLIVFVAILAGAGIKWLIFPFQGDLNERLLGSLVLSFALTIEAGLFIVAVEKIGKYQFTDKESKINSWAMPLLVDAKAVYTWTGLNPAFWEDLRIRFLLRDSLKKGTRVRIWTMDPGHIPNESHRSKAEELIAGLQKLSSTGDLQLVLLGKHEVPDYPHFVLVEVKGLYDWLPQVFRRLTIQARHKEWWERESAEWPYGTRYEMYTFNPLLAAYLQHKVSTFPLLFAKKVSYEWDLSKQRLR